MHRFFCNTCFAASKIHLESNHCHSPQYKTNTNIWFRTFTQFNSMHDPLNPPQEQYVRTMHLEIPVVIEFEQIDQIMTGKIIWKISLFFFFLILFLQFWNSYDFMKWLSSTFHIYFRECQDFLSAPYCNASLIDCVWSIWQIGWSISGHVFLICSYCH